jgi:hypothetical protein
MASGNSTTILFQPSGIGDCSINFCQAFLIRVLTYCRDFEKWIGDMGHAKEGIKITEIAA